MSKHSVIKLYTSLIPLLNLDKFAKLICNVVKLKFATIKYIPGQGLGPVIDYRGGGGGNEKLDVNILLPPPFSLCTIMHDSPCNNKMQMIERYTCPHKCTVICLFQCTSNEISPWLKYITRYVLHFCFSSYVINNSTYTGFPKTIFLTTQPRNDARRSLYGTAGSRRAGFIMYKNLYPFFFMQKDI